MYKMDEKTQLNTLCIVKDEPLEKIEDVSEYIKLEDDCGDMSVEDWDSDLKQDLTGSTWTKTYVNEYDTILDICKEEFCGNNLEMLQIAQADLPSDGVRTMRSTYILPITTDDKQMKTENVGNDESHRDKKNSTNDKLKVLNEIVSSEGRTEKLINRSLKRKSITIEGDLENVRSRKKNSTVLTKQRSNEKPFSCNQCSYKCTRKLDLVSHMRIHTGDKPFLCPHCSYKCRRKDNLALHVRIHTGEKPFSCAHCNYKCRVRSSLFHHMKVHTGEKPFSCAHCSYKCWRKIDLKKHTCIHTGGKHFSCAHCIYKCKLKSNLTNHMKIHTGEKPFSCAHCNYKCVSKRYLISHTWIHTGEKPFSCAHCSYKCRQKINLSTHIRIHTDEKPFSCAHCSYKCRRKSSLTNHTLIHTGEKPFS